MSEPPKQLPSVDVFNPSFEKWLMREATMQEIENDPEFPKVMLRGVRDKLTHELCNHLDSAVYIADKRADNELEHFIDCSLKANSHFRIWRSAMPKIIPKEISNYQNKYPHYNQKQLETELSNINCILSSSQTLVHAGLWPESRVFTTDRPLSTSFCPQVALRNAEHMGKAYDNGRINLIVLSVVQPKTSVYVFRQRGSNKGHEKEVLFNTGARLEKISEKYIKQVKAYKYEGCNRLEKDIPIYVIEAEIS